MNLIRHYKNWEAMDTDRFIPLFHLQNSIDQIILSLCFVIAQRYQ